MWKSFLDALVEAFAMCDPVAYMYYIECKRETQRQAAAAAPCQSVDRYVDQWVALSERTGMWQDNGGVGARRRRNEKPA